VAAGRRYLVVKGSSGLGNRMFAALTGVLYARLSGRELYIDWSDAAYSDDGSNVFHRFFVCPLFGPGDDFPATDSVTPEIWRGHLRDSVPELGRRYGHITRRRLRRELTARRVFQRLSSIDLAELEHDAEVAVWWNWTQLIDPMRPHLRRELPELGRMSNPQILRRLLARELVLHPRIQERVDEFRSRHFDGPTVGVHLRLSDRRVRTAEILDKLDRLLSREPGLRVFGATDNVEAAESLKRRYGPVIMTPHWFPAVGESLHLNRNCPDLAESGVEALVDMYLLAGCDYLIGDSTSSFTRVAAILRPEDSGTFVDVKPKAIRGLHLARAKWRRHAASGMVRKAARARRSLHTA
jgi:Nodulation protein Z (NodZ)